MSPGRPGGPGATVLSALRRLAAAAPDPEPVSPPADQPQPCEMCGAGMDERHGHVADTRDHRLLCVCRPCHLLFDRAGPGGVRYRGVGADIRLVVDPALDRRAWEDLAIPVDLVFVLAQSPAPPETEDEPGADAAVPERRAFYPGPGGATESLLELGWWEGLVEANPALDSVEPDVEAVLLRREGDEVTCLVVPVDRCYELVGEVRNRWVGLAGGREVWERIDAFFDDLVGSGRTVDRSGEGLPARAAAGEA